MTGYEAFCIYNALKLHFTQKSYDFFKYNGKSKISVDAFEVRKDKYHFYKLSRKFDDAEEYKTFLISNFLTNSSKKSWIGSFMDDQAFDEFKKRKKILQSLTYRFTEDCKLLFSDDKNPNDYLKTTGDYPELLVKTLQKDINLETLIILNGLLNFFPLWNKKINDTIRWPEFQMMCLKYEPFIDYDKAKCRSILKDCIHTCIS
jgi:hypothetical protein